MSSGSASSRRRLRTNAQLEAEWRATPLLADALRTGPAGRIWRKEEMTLARRDFLAQTCYLQAAERWRGGWQVSRVVEALRPVLKEAVYVSNDLWPLTVAHDGDVFFVGIGHICRMRGRGVYREAMVEMETSWAPAVRAGHKYICRLSALHRRGDEHLLPP